METRNEEVDRFLGWILKHVVPIRFIFERGSEQRPYLITAFVLSIGDRWLLLTAGHCLTKVSQILASGYTISVCELVDNLGPGATSDNALPINWEEASPLVPFEDPTMDYGIVFLHPLWCRGLEKNGVQALSEEVWDKQPTSPELFFLCGVPEDLNPPSLKNVNNIASTLHVITPEAERPDGFEQTTAPMFYGRVRRAYGLNTLHGMSGAPVFSMQRVDGDVRYWLHAMQVSWNPFDYISAVLVKPFAALLRDITERYEKQEQSAAPPT